MSDAVQIVAGDFHDPASEDTRRRRRRRYAADRRLRYCGLGAIALAIALLGLLFVSLMSTGYTAFVQTMVELEISLDAGEIDLEDPYKANWRAIARAPLAEMFPDLPRRDRRAMFAMLSSGAPYILRDKVIADPDMVGRTVKIKLPVSDPFDQLNKGSISRDVPENRRRVSDKQIAWFDMLVERGLVSTPFNTGLFTNADSRFPETAGVFGAIVGSFYALLVCFIVSFPVGIAAAVYLEEFAPKTRWTDFIEVNINNLAAVPSIVFGLLALAVFLGWFGLPRSAPLVGGLALALMTLPTMIIVTRAALRSVPPSISEAALGIGASKHETILHHVLPLALPSILTGTIIGLAQALGETAPLLLIGMNAFITNPPAGVMDASTALPTQIFIWADSPERGFVSRTSAAILILLGFLVTMNAIAVILRQRYQRGW
jgi:phosphate transport system permease protein